MEAKISTDQSAGQGTPAPATPAIAYERCAALIKQAMLAFRRDLPQLLPEHQGQWVAYHGDRQLGIGATRWELVHKYFRQGLLPEEFLVRGIEPEDPSLAPEPSEGPMSQSTSIDQSAGVGSPPAATTTADQERSAALIKQAMLTFWRDLAQLLQERPGQWVAYHGDRQLGFAATQLELWQECIRQGLPPDEFLVRSIEPEDPNLVLEGTEIE